MNGAIFTVTAIIAEDEGSGSAVKRASSVAGFCRFEDPAIVRGVGLVRGAGGLGIGLTACEGYAAQRVTVRILDGSRMRDI